MTDFQKLKKQLLWSMIGALMLSAALGIYALLAGDLGHFEVKILLTTLAVSAFSLTGLACAAAQEYWKAYWFTIPGLAFSVIGFLLVMLAIWAELIEKELFLKTMLIAIIFTVAFAHAALLTFSWRIPSNRAVYIGTVALIFALAFYLTLLVIWEEWGESSGRAIGVLAILVSLGTLALPVLHKIRNEPAAGLKVDRIEVVCPRCKQSNSIALGGRACPSCGLRIRVEIEGI